MNDSAKVAITPQQKRISEGLDSPLALYKEMVVGEKSYAFLAWYELCTLLGTNLPGIVGYATRAILYKTLLLACDGSPHIGRGVILRNPNKISLGSKVLVDDFAVLDARGPESSLQIDSLASIGRFTTIAAKNGKIRIGAGSNIGTYCRIATQSNINIGESVLVAAYSYIGPGNHQKGDGSTTLIEREMEIKGGVNIDSHAWIGAKATILDGVSVGRGAIVAAHSLVRDNVEPYAIVAGTPAKVIGRAEDVLNILGK